MRNASISVMHQPELDARDSDASKPTTDLYESRKGAVVQIRDRFDREPASARRQEREPADTKGAGGSMLTFHMR